MAQPFMGEIRMFAGNFAPAGWMFCEGQLLPISENDALFVLLGTTYGGDGQSTFALPDLRGRVPMHAGSGVIQAETGGVESVTLSVNQIAAHSHPFLAVTDTPNTTNPQNSRFAVPVASIYNTGTNPVSMSAQAVTPVGGSQPHDNFQPYLCVNFIISLFGLFPNPS